MVECRSISDAAQADLQAYEITMKLKLSEKKAMIAEMAEKRQEAEVMIHRLHIYIYTYANVDDNDDYDDL